MKNKENDFLKVSQFWLNNRLKTRPLFSLAAAKQLFLQPDVNLQNVWDSTWRGHKK